MVRWLLCVAQATLHFLMFAAWKVYHLPCVRCIMIGERIPDLTLPVTRCKPELHTEPTSLIALFTGQRTLVIAHPGAFTHNSTMRMLPDYSEKLPDLKKAGVSQVFAFSVNDKFVQEAYTKKYQFGLDTICDWSGELTHSLELGLPAELYFSYITRRAIFLVDETGTILGIRAEENVQYTRQTAPVSALSMISACFGSPT